MKQPGVPQHGLFIARCVVLCWSRDSFDAVSVLLVSKEVIPQTCNKSLLCFSFQ